MSTKAEVATSYDVGNDFFRLWLDAGMNYTCGVWDGVTTLEEAQQQKLRVLSDFAHITPGARVLDIGCGWGGALDYVTGVRGATAHGITLSEAQCDEISRRQLPRTTAELADYRDFEPRDHFDAALSICMMEHIATPQEARRGEHVPLYRDYFRRVHSWTRPGAWFGLQTILRDRVPRSGDDLRELHWVTHTIFPGGISLRLEDVVSSVGPYWEIVTIRTRREDYARTTAEWLARLVAKEGEIRARWGDGVFDDYHRYLRTCVRAFTKHYQSLAQYELRRIDR